VIFEAELFLWFQGKNIKKTQKSQKIAFFQIYCSTMTGRKNGVPI